MKNRLLIFSFILLSLLGSDTAYATHIFGGELLYRNIIDTTDTANKNLYIITLTLYGDCSGQSFPTLATATPQVIIYNGSSVFKTLNLQKDAANSNIEVSPVCPSQIGNTTCNSAGTLPGVKKFVYFDTVQLSGPSVNWQFVFTGVTSASSSAGRSNSITNVQNVGVTTIYLVATLNNTIGVNNSPGYSTVPTPFYCINIQQQYNQGAIDPDNDSLRFSLTDGLSAGTTVSYVSPYSATNPLSASSFSFSALSGQMSFDPDAIQDALVVTKVSEYRNGVLIGTSMREMTFIVLDNCQNTPPVSRIVGSSVIGAAVQSDNVLNVCTGTPEVSFELQGSDDNGDNVNVNINNVPANALVTTTGNNSNTPLIHFDWNTANVPPGIYNLFLTLKDNHCPITSTQTMAYTINIVDTSVISETILLPTQCLHQAYVQFNLLGGTIPRTIVVTRDSTPFSLYNDYTGIVRDSFPTGNYKVYVSSYAYNCSSQSQFTVPDNGDLPIQDTTILTYCVNDTASAVDLLSIPGATASWLNSEGNPIPSAPVPNTSVAGISVFYVTEQYRTCTSLQDTVSIVVHGLPQITFPDIPASVCVGDKVYLMASGGFNYQWYPKDSIYTDQSGNYYVVALAPETYTVTASNEYNCIDSASVTISDIEACCQFSYPNAFTPNGDGKNDKYGIPVYGNLSSYELSIYDRWGKRVFHSYDVKEHWDGTYGGKPCNMGTYYYLLRAHCVSGHTEEHFGDITLIR